MPFRPRPWSEIEQEGGGASSFADLTDVDWPTFADGESPVYDAGAGKLVGETVAGAISGPGDLAAGGDFFEKLGVDAAGNLEWQSPSLVAVVDLIGAYLYDPNNYLGGGAGAYYCSGRDPGNRYWTFPITPADSGKKYLVMAGLELTPGGPAPHGNGTGLATVNGSGEVVFDADQPGPGSIVTLSSSFSTRLQSEMGWSSDSLAWITQSLVYESGNDAGTFGPGYSSWIFPQNAYIVASVGQLAYVLERGNSGGSLPQAHWHDNRTWVRNDGFPFVYLTPDVGVILCDGITPTTPNGPDNQFMLGHTNRRPGAQLTFINTQAGVARIVCDRSYDTAELFVITGFSVTGAGPYTYTIEVQQIDPLFVVGEQIGGFGWTTDTKWNDRFEITAVTSTTVQFVHDDGSFDLTMGSDLISTQLAIDANAGDAFFDVVDGTGIYVGGKLFLDDGTNSEVVLVNDVSNLPTVGIDGTLANPYASATPTTVKGARSGRRFRVYDFTTGTGDVFRQGVASFNYLELTTEGDTVTVVADDTNNAWWVV